MKNYFIEFQGDTYFPTFVLNVNHPKDSQQTQVLSNLEQTSLMNQFKGLSCHTHCLGMNYYVNFWGGIGSNGFHIK